MGSYEVSWPTCTALCTIIIKLHMVINGFTTHVLHMVWYLQLLWYGHDSWFSNHPPTSVKTSGESSTDESTKLLKDRVSDTMLDHQINASKRELSETNRTCRSCCVSITRFISLSYIVLGLFVFAVGFFLRTISFFSLLGPLSCFCVVFCANEYFRLRQSKKCFQ